MKRGICFSVMGMYEIFKAEYGKSRVIYKGYFTDERPSSRKYLKHKSDPI